MLTLAGMWLESASTHFLATPLGKEDQSTIHMSDDHGKKEGDPIEPFNPDNIIHPIMIDQFSEDLLNLVEEKNAANLQAALASCSLDQQGGVVKQFKVVNSRYTTCK